MPRPVPARLIRLLFLFVPGTLTTQEAPATRGFCWIAHPLPQCRATGLWRFSVLAPVGGVTLGEDPASDYPTGATVAAALDIGVLWNRSEKWAVGFNGYALGFEDMRLGLLAAGRYWVTKDVALDFAPGITLALLEEPSGDANLPGFAGRLGITWKEWIGLELRMDALRVASYDPNGSGALLPAETRVGWFLGAHLGTRPGPIGTLLTLVAGLIAVATYEGL